MITNVQKITTVVTVIHILIDTLKKDNYSKIDAEFIEDLTGLAINLMQDNYESVEDLQNKIEETGGILLTKIVNKYAFKIHAGSSTIN